MKIKAIIFDVDGVLIEPKVFAKVLECDYHLTRQQIESFFEGPFRQCLLGKADFRSEVPRFLDEWKWPHSIEKFMEIWFKADSRKNSELFDFAQEMRKRGVLCYIASTQEQYRAAYLEDQLRLGNLFDGLFFSCRLGCQKPELKFYEIASSRVPVEPNEILFLDDIIENVLAAKKTGWNAELYTIGMDFSAILKKYSFTAALIAGN